MPYYNPLEDPFLEGFFSNYKNESYIRSNGLVYSPRKEYPYDERRLTNSNKFLRSNTYKVPPINLISSRNRLPLNASSILDEKAELRSTQSQFHKKLSESDIFGNTPTSMRDFISRRPFSRDRSNSSGHGIVIFKKRNLSSTANNSTQPLV